MGLKVPVGPFALWAQRMKGPIGPFKVHRALKGPMGDGALLAQLLLPASPEVW